MNEKPSICAIIGIKANSKRVPGKNMRLMAGKPMMAYILDAAKGAEGLTRLVVSTESEEIASIAREHGADVVMRPPALTEDHVTTFEVMAHALKELKDKEGYRPDYSMILYATSPLLARARIEEAIRIVTERRPEALTSGYPDKGNFWTKGEDGLWDRLYPLTNKNSQFQTSLFRENGALGILKTEYVENGTLPMRLEVLMMEKDENVDVDWPEDFEKAEQILLKRNAKDA